LTILNHAHTTVSSITKTVRIDCNPQAAFECLADLGIWGIFGDAGPLWLAIIFAGFSLFARPNPTLIVGLSSRCQRLPRFS
jgi:hypothetical protein